MQSENCWHGPIYGELVLCSLNIIVCIVIAVIIVVRPNPYGQ